MPDPSPKLALRLLKGSLAVCRLGPDEPIPGWALNSGFYSITRSPDELSIVCAEAAIPTGVRCAGGFRAFGFEGPFAFTQTGILASVIGPLAGARISVFAIATFDTDYVLVKQEDVECASRVLASAGHNVRSDDPRKTLLPHQRQ